jgi:hypothetical protein
MVDTSRNGWLFQCHIWGRTKYRIFYLLSRLLMITTGDQSARNGDSSTKEEEPATWVKNTIHLVVSDVQPHRHGVLVAIHPSPQKRFAMIRGGHGVPESQEGPELEREISYPVAMGTLQLPNDQKTLQEWSTTVDCKFGVIASTMHAPKNRELASSCGYRQYGTLNTPTIPDVLAQVQDFKQVQMHSSYL